MQSKSLLIAIAAFAVTTTGAQAYGSTILDRAKISDDKRHALEEARELRQNGDPEAARDLLVEAGIDEEVLHELREAARETRAEIMLSVETGDYELFKELVADTPLSDVIISEADFERFREAQTLRQTGGHEGARSIIGELGIEKSHKGHKRNNHHLVSQLSDEQREALKVARQANNRETVKAILKEAGIERE